MKFPQIFKPKLMPVNSVVNKLPGIEAENMIDEVSKLLDKISRGYVEVEEEITAENDPQGAMKINMPQGGAEVSASKSQKYHKKLKIKVNKL